MGLTYPTPVTLSNQKDDGYFAVLNECYDFFSDTKGLSIFSEAYRSIISNSDNWALYTDKMMDGVDLDEREHMNQLMENSRMECLLTESLSGITPISSLSVPTIRRLWPKLAIKNALITEVVKLPKFTLSYMMPYIKRNGVKYYLPQGILEDGEVNPYNQGTKLFDGDIMLDDFNIDSETVDGARKGFKLLENLPDGTVASAVANDSLDPDFTITAIAVECTVQSGSTETVWFTGYNLQCNLDGSFYYELKDMVKPGDVENGALQGSAKYTSDTLFGSIDFGTGILKITSSNGKVKGVRVKGRLSQEFNNRSESVSFDITTRDITIGTGQHLNAPITTEFMQDVQALYNIDAAAKIVDIMTNVFATRLDLEMLEFLNASAANTKYVGKFDCKPLASFAGTPRQWRELLKDVIDYQSQLMKQDHWFEGGSFSIIGNPIDTVLLPNVTWTYEGKTGNTKSGVEVDYSIGAWSGINHYTIVSSTNVKRGELIMIYNSPLDEQYTYRYYPYTFNVEKGYTDPNAPYVPSIMMAKRHKLEKFTECIARIKIINNNGDPNFAG